MVTNSATFKHKAAAGATLTMHLIGCLSFKGVLLLRDMKSSFGGMW